MSEKDRVQYKFMIPTDLKARIENAAHDHRRSLSGEIIHALEEAYPDPLSKEAELRLAAGAAMMLKPVKPNSEFTEQYDLVLAYIVERFGLDDAQQAERLINEVWRDKATRQSILIDQVHGWIENTLTPWIIKVSQEPSPLGVHPDDLAKT
ncbi:hypothetical protein [Sulfitobacter faviae]|uniref:hypothetical protein n=1 Tax=Sulfitobacter faviae TaxID=1775881 RepID=UPI00118C36AA|nr:MAG: hypothetical protein GOVbin2937_31 [Prokaryotic dsDNA virus sp.]